MSSNPPAGYSRITPYLNYEDVDAMMPWLEKAFGFVERHRSRAEDGSTFHAEMVYEGGIVMMGRPGGDFRNPKSLGRTLGSLYIYVPDIESHFARAEQAGAEIIEPLGDQPYGDRRYGAADPEGHRWYFASPIARDEPEGG